MEKEKSVSFAIIETGGKQYKVSSGDMVDVELLGELNDGDAVTFDKVLLKEDAGKVTIGAPYIEGAKVSAVYRKEKLGPKLLVMRYKAKSNRDRKQGHRQHYARVEITSI